MNKNNKQISTLLLIILVGFPQISETIFTPSLPQIAQSYQVSLNTAQLTLSIYFFSFALGVFFWGLLSDYTGRRPAMLYGIFVYGVGSLLCYFAKDINILLFARFVQAFGASTGSVTTQTILREHFDGNKRHALFAQISAALAFTPAIGPLIGGIVGQYAGFRAVFLVLVILSVFVFIYAFIGVIETYDTSKRVKVEVMPILCRMLKSPKVLTFGLIIGVLNGILFSYYAEAPFIFMEYFGMSQSSYGFLGIVIAGASILGAFLSKSLLKKMAAHNIVLLGLKVMLFGSCLLLLSGYCTFLPKMVQLILILGCIFITLTGSGITLPNCLSLALVDFQDVIGTAGALFSLGYYFLVSGITFGMSSIHNGSLSAMPLYFIGLSLTLTFFTVKNIAVPKVRK